MGREYGVRGGEDWTPGGRLLLEHVEGRARDRPGRERVRQSGLVHDLPPRAVHDVRGPLHERELLRADHPLRLRGEGRVDAEIVRLHQEGGEAVDESDPPLLRRGWREIWIERDHVHPEGLRPPRDLRADPTGAEEPEDLPVELPSLETLLLPLPRLHRAIRLRDLAGEGEHVAERELCDGDRAPGGRVHHGDPFRGRGLDVDVIDADARATDDLEFRRFREDLRSDLRPAADDERIVVRDDLDELLRVRLDDVDVMDRAELRDRFRLQAIRDEDPHRAAKGGSVLKSGRPDVSGAAGSRTIG